VTLATTCYCDHERRFHGRGVGKCWAKRGICRCPRFAARPEESKLGDLTHVIPYEEIVAATRAGILIVSGPVERP
jgi:hypothetical protein